VASVAGPRPPCGVHPAVASSWSGRPVSSPSGVQRPVSGRPVSSVRCPASGVQPVWCPARPVSSPSGVQPAAVRPRSVRTRPSRPTSGGGVGDRVGAADTPHHSNGSRSVGLPRRGVAGSTLLQARTRARLPSSRVVGGSVVDPGRVGCGRPRLTAGDRQAWPACGAPSRAAALRAEEQAAARGGRSGRVAAALGLVGDHVRWWSWCLTPGWPGPEGPVGVPAGVGVRPRRGPSWRRALPARYRQRCDLGEWLVGLPGLEPGTSS
jgi:hypothetical protein